jgi:Protein of unknown function (DUF2997)
MEIHEVELIIEANGHTRVEVRGVKGPSCLELTRQLEAALGGQVLSRQLTAEASEPPARQLQQRLWQRTS